MRSITQNNMVSEKVLILGAKGMLGQELVRVFSLDERYVVAGWDREDIDVTDFAEAEKKIREYAPQIIVNAVAYNAVDQCEENDEEYEKAMTLNSEAPKFLAHVAKEINAMFAHYSTDYVFDGESQRGYAEDAEPSPLSRYGMSKREGEENVLAERGKFYLIRLSKLFGKPASSAGGKKSFFEKMLEVAKARPAEASGVARRKSEVSVVDDEKSCFTYAPDLAEATKELIQDNAPYGIYHLPNSGGATWYEAAAELFRLAKIYQPTYNNGRADVVVKPVSADAFPRAAKRPKYSVLLNIKRPALRSYTEALKEFLQSN
jgi:dTDP-4-dehydrorhamnose reductase